MSQATIVLKEESYLLADHWYRVLEDIYVSDWGSITIVSLDNVNQNKFSSRYTLLLVHYR